MLKTYWIKSSDFLSFFFFLINLLNLPSLFCLKVLVCAKDAECTYRWRTCQMAAFFFFFKCHFAIYTVIWAFFVSSWAWSITYALLLSLYCLGWLDGFLPDRMNYAMWFIFSYCVEVILGKNVNIFKACTTGRLGFEYKIKFYWTFPQWMRYLH